MISSTFGIFVAFLIYFLAMIVIGIFSFRHMKSISDYILGSRKLGSWVTSMSAEAADMSGWLMLGLPGYAYLKGLEAGWIALGLIIGTYINWKLVAGRLRIYTEIANDSLTIPDYLQNRFHDNSMILRIISAVFILLFFLLYTSSGFVAGGRLFHTVFGIPYLWAMLITASVVIIYTFLGGFMAVCWTDFIQGILMFFAILIVPITGIIVFGGPAQILKTLQELNHKLLNPWISIEGEPLSIRAIISLMGWGLGYFGQPHIIVRFMAIKSAKQIPQARLIGMVWVIFTLTAAVAVGIVGRVTLKEVLTGAATETVFMVMTGKLFSPFIAGIILSGILAAIMSTASAQLLVASSVISEDLSRAIFHKEAGQSNLLGISRFSVIFISLLAIIIGMDPDNLVLDLVAYAWAGFGAAFGPVILMSLYWKRMTRNGALAGMMVGGMTVLIWKQFGWFGIYEIIPGFVFSMLAIMVVSFIDREPSEKVLREFDQCYLNL